MGGRFSKLVAMVSLLVFSAAGTADAATYSVTGVADSTAPCTGTVCPSLRAAITKANAEAGPDEIDLSADTFRIELAASAEEDANATGDLDVTGDLVIKGADSGRTVIEGALVEKKGERDLEVLGTAQLTLSHLSVTKGRQGELGTSSKGGGGIAAIGKSTLRLEHMTVADNTAVPRGFFALGGGVSAVEEAHLVATDTTILKNEASVDGFGGGLYVDEAAQAELTNVTVLANHSTNFGGGIFDGPGSIRMAFTTVYLNASGEGNGLYSAGPTHVRDSIIGDGCAPADKLVSEGGNVVDASCKAAQPGDVTVSDPLLSELTGSLELFAPKPGSPALDRALPPCPPFDARGVARPQGSACDSGAVEIPVASTPGGPGPGGSVTPGTKKAPVVSAATQRSTRWRLGNRKASIAARRPPVGTVFTVAVDQPASISLSFAKKVPGRRVRGRCVAPSRRNGGRPRCRRSLARGILTLSAHAGTNKISFQGRISTTRKLTPGSYTVKIVATGSGGRSKPRTLAFTIVR